MPMIGLDGGVPSSGVGKVLEDAHDGHTFAERQMEWFMLELCVFKFWIMTDDCISAGRSKNI